MTTTALDPRAQPLQIRPAATAAVRPADPTKERFEVGERRTADKDAAAVDQDTAQAFSVDADESAAFASGRAAARSSRGGNGLLGAFTSFLAKIFTQGDNNTDFAASARLNGIGAYGRANSQQASPLSGFTNDVQSPGLPRLASGRVLDLTI